jgi:NAD(P)-dependent dehydrogenase (short-subunit alcohol dehydrogenase family)
MSGPGRQRVLVTAAADGIGRVIAERFADGGAAVQLCDLDDEALATLRAQRPDIAASRVDVADPAEVDAFVERAVAELGGLDVLVNNAGIKGPTALVEDVAVDDWRRCLAVCVESHFLFARRVVPVLKAQRCGAVINLSSIAGTVGFGLRSPYAAAKWAVIGFTKSLAVELGPHGVRCNAICPGTVRGDRMDRVIADEAAQRGISRDQVQEEYLAGQSIARFVEPGEVADLCWFLASPAATMITGQAIGVDGHTETYHLG